MRDFGIDKGLIETRDTSSRNQRGWKEGFFGFRKMFWDYLNKLNVPFYDSCCVDAPSTLFPVQFNATTGGFERFNGTTWVAADDTISGGQTGLTAHAGGTQALGVPLTSGYNEITVSATAGDSVKLPTAVAGLTVTVKNDGATAIDVFPFLGDTINDGAANTAVRVAPASTVQFNAINATNWEASNQVVGVGDGAAATPSVTFAAQPNMGLYKVSSTQLGVSIGGALVGGFNANGLFTDVISEQTGTVGVTVDSVLLKDGGVSNSGLTQIAGFFPLTAAQALSGPGAVNVTAYLTKYTSTAGAEALTLAAGTQIGQRKRVVHVADGGSGVLTGTYVGGTTITFTTVAEFADLLWTGAAWAVLELGNSATPGVPCILA